jgi:hypothetical protein
MQGGCLALASSLLRALLVITPRLLIRRSGSLCISPAHELEVLWQQMLLAKNFLFLSICTFSAAGAAAACTLFHATCTLVCSNNSELTGLHHSRKRS